MALHRLTLLSLLCVLSGCVNPREARAPATAPGLQGTQVQPVYLLAGGFNEGKVALTGAGFSHYHPSDTREERARSALDELLAFSSSTPSPFFWGGKRLYSMVPPRTRLLDLRLREDMLTVDLSGEALDLKKAAQGLPNLTADNGLRIATEPNAGAIALAQVVFTATDACGDVGVQILFDGRKREFWGPSLMLAETEGPRYRGEFLEAFALSGRRAADGPGDLPG